jgi:hypothetical protein
MQTIVIVFKGRRNLKKRNLLSEIYKLDIGKEIPYLRAKLNIRLRRTDI